MFMGFPGFRDGWHDGLLHFDGQRLAWRCPDGRLGELPGSSGQVAQDHFQERQLLLAPSA